MVDLKKIMMAFDTNRNGLIEEQEFIQLIEKARNASVTIVESPQKNRVIREEPFPQDRRKKLPVKENQ